MKSPQAQEVAAALPVQEDNEIGLLDLALIVAENLRLLIIGPLVVGGCALAYSYSIAPTYTARTVFLPPQQQQSSAAAALQSLGALAGIAGGAAGIKSPADQYVALMQTTTVEDSLIERFKLMEVYEAELKADARKALELNTRISAGKRDGLLTVEVDDADPQRAADMANAYVDELRRLTSNLAMTEAQQRRAFFEMQLAETKARLAGAQRALQAAGINEGAIRAEPRAAAEAYAKLQAEITAGEVRVQTMRGYLAETAPEFKQAQSQLAALRAQLARREAVNVTSAQGDYVDRFREFKYQETLFDLFARQYEVARLDESREGALIQVVDTARAPERRSNPKRAQMAILATLASGVTLLLWVFMRHAWRNARQDVRTGNKAEQLLKAVRISLGRSS